MLVVGCRRVARRPGAGRTAAPVPRSAAHLLLSAALLLLLPPHLLLAVVAVAAALSRVDILPGTTTAVLLQESKHVATEPR